MRSQKLKIWTAVLIVLVLLAAGTGGVYAYLSANSGPVSNTFTPETPVTPSAAVSTTGAGQTYNVTVNVPDAGYAVYVRAAVVVTWQKDGQIYGQAPVYTVSGANWFKHGDFYYYKLPVSSSAPLNLEVNVTSSTPPAEGYKIHVEVISQTIQAVGTVDGGTTPAVTDAWGVIVDSNGNLTN